MLWEGKKNKCSTSLLPISLLIARHKQAGHNHLALLAVLITVMKKCYNTEYFSNLMV